ncbi:hypothetical protein L1887_34045 [Cichorium endivia]|nr:hypothetical protein L1887_34045 [Cichorium endivia]
METIIVTLELFNDCRLLPLGNSSVLSSASFTHIPFLFATKKEKPPSSLSLCQKRSLSKIILSAKFSGSSAINRRKTRLKP